MRFKLIATAIGACLLAACSSSPTAVSIPTATPALIVTSGGPQVTATTEAAIPTTPEPTSTTAPTLPAPTADVVTPAVNEEIGVCLGKGDKPESSVGEHERQVGGQAVGEQVGFRSVVVEEVDPRGLRCTEVRDGERQGRHHEDDR